MDTSLYTTVKWCSRKEESHFIRYGAVHDVSYRLVYFLLEIYPRNCCLYPEQSPSKFMPSTSYEIWRGKKSNLKYFKILDCPAYVKRNFRHKLSARADKCLFVDYLKESIGYLFYHPTE